MIEILIALWSIAKVIFLAIAIVLVALLFELFFEFFKVCKCPCCGNPRQLVRVGCFDNRPISPFAFICSRCDNEGQGDENEDLLCENEGAREHIGLY